MAPLNGRNDSSQWGTDASKGVKAGTPHTKKVAGKQTIYPTKHVLVWIFINGFLRKCEIGSKGSGAASKLLPQWQSLWCSCIRANGWQAFKVMLLCRLSLPPL